MSRRRGGRPSGRCVSRRVTQGMRWSAELAHRDQDFDEAEEWYRYAARVDPRNPAVLSRVARGLLSYGLGAEAEVLARRGLAISETAELWGALGLRFALNGDEARAIDAYRRALALDPAHAEARGYLEPRGFVADQAGAPGGPAVQPGV